MSKKRTKKQSKHKQSNKEAIYELAYWLSEDTGISISEALGYFLGIENPTYGWEDELSLEEFDALFDRKPDIPDSSEYGDLPF